MDALPFTPAGKHAMISAMMQALTYNTDDDWHGPKNDTQAAVAEAFRTTVTAFCSAAEEPC